jgi:hypothetical protein
MTIREDLKLLYIWVNIGVIAFGGIVFGYWYLEGTYINIPIIPIADQLNLKTDKAEYHAGEEVGVYNSFCKQGDLPAVFAPQFIDDEQITLTPIEVNLPKGCVGIDKPFRAISFKIPVRTHSGVWHLEWTVSIHVNPIKTIIYNRKTVDFMILD